MKSILKLWALALAVGSALIFSGCADSRRYDAEARSQTGELIGRWEDVRLVKGRTGWVILETRDGKQVLIEGPHILVQR